VKSMAGPSSSERHRNPWPPTVVGRATATSHEPPTQAGDWRSRARCQGEPTEIFFAADNERGARLRRKERHAKRICQGCEVLEHCRNYALDAGEPYGIWGALTPTERRHLRADDPWSGLTEL